MKLFILFIGLTPAVVSASFYYIASANGHCQGDSAGIATHYMPCKEGKVHLINEKSMFKPYESGWVTSIIYQCESEIRSLDNPGPNSFSTFCDPLNRQSIEDVFQSPATKMCVLPQDLLSYSVFQNRKWCLVETID